MVHIPSHGEQLKRDQEPHPLDKNRATKTEKSSARIVTN